MYEAHDALEMHRRKNFIDDKNRFRLGDHHFLKNDNDIVKII